MVMKAESLNIGVFSINKFIFYALNYPLVEFQVMWYDGNTRTKYLPDCFKVFEGFTLTHIASKWEECCEKTDGYGRLIKFYTELGGESRSKVLKYIMENYNDEQRISI
jgi:hypothetical protein